MFIYKLQDEVNDNDFKYIKILKEKIKNNCIRTGINFVTYNLHNSNLDF